MYEKIFFEDALISDTIIYYKGEKVGTAFFLNQWKAGKIDLTDVRIRLRTENNNVREECFDYRDGHYELEITDLKNYIVIVEDFVMKLYRANVVCQIDGCKIISDGKHSALIRLNNMSEFIYQDIPIDVVLNEEDNSIKDDFLKSCMAF